MAVSTTEKPEVEMDGHPVTQTNSIIHQTTLGNQQVKPPIRLTPAAFEINGQSELFGMPECREPINY